MQLKPESVYSHHYIEDRYNTSFDKDEYSKFKYGSGEAAKKFGRELAYGFMESDLFDDVISHNKPIVVLYSPYGYIQSAATVIAREFINIVNLHLIQRNIPPMSEFKTTRDKYYTDDYASMSAEDRRKLINGDRFHVSKSFLAGKVLIHIDDIKITGGHEEVIERIFHESELSETGAKAVFLYYAELINKSENANIEAYLNEHFIKRLRDLNPLIKGDYEFNTRAIKFILGAKSNEFQNFIMAQNQKFLDELMYKAIGEGYYVDPKFSDNLKSLIHYNTAIPDEAEYVVLSN